ncbi:MAG: type II toxin-antitoxin system VapC family toxin, partial [Acidobacteriota bacterium]
RLSEIEVTSALARRHREGAVDQSQLDAMLDELDQDIHSLMVVELSPEVLSVARALLTRHLLRAADSLQLASALSLADRLERPVRMVAFDHRLMASATQEGLDIADFQ